MPHQVQHNVREFHPVPGFEGDYLMARNMEVYSTLSDRYLRQPKNRYNRKTGLYNWGTMTLNGYHGPRSFTLARLYALTFLKPGEHLRGYKLSELFATTGEKPTLPYSIPKAEEVQWVSSPHYRCFMPVNSFEHATQKRESFDDISDALRAHHPQMKREEILTLVGLMRKQERLVVGGFYYQAL